MYFSLWLTHPSLFFIQLPSYTHFFTLSNLLIHHTLHDMHSIFCNISAFSVLQTMQSILTKGLSKSCKLAYFPPFYSSSKQILCNEMHDSFIRCCTQSSSRWCCRNPYWKTPRWFESGFLSLRDNRIGSRSYFHQLIWSIRLAHWQCYWSRLLV